MSNKSQKSLIKEQNRSLIIISGVLLGLIAFVAIASLFIGPDEANDDKAPISKDGIVNDLEGIRD